MKGNSAIRSGNGSRGGVQSAPGDDDPLQLSDAYVHSLASLGLDRLQNEPGRLNEESAAVDEVLFILAIWFCPNKFGGSFCSAILVVH